jgi:hypothetical protein
VATWYAKDFGNFVTSDRILNETKKGFFGATALAASINYGYTGIDTGWDGGYDDTALKLGQGMSMLTSVYTMGAGGFSPGGSPVFATPNGNIPVTKPIVLAPTKATDVHGNVYAKKQDGKQFDDVCKELGIKNKKAFSEYLHKVKKAEGRGPNDHYAYEDLLQIGKDYLADGGV